MIYWTAQCFDRWIVRPKDWISLESTLAGTGCRTDSVCVWEQEKEEWFPGITVGTYSINYNYTDQCMKYHFYH